MEAPISGQEILNFSDQIKLEFGNYPWITQVDVNQRGEFMCGDINYSLKAISYTENPIEPLVVLIGDQIFLQPTESFAPGSYTVELVGTLADYPDISKSEVFTVKVDTCEATLDSGTLVGGIYVKNAWYTQDQGTNFMDKIDMLNQTPDC